MYYSFGTGRQYQDETLMSFSKTTNTDIIIIIIIIGNEVNFVLKIASKTVYLSLNHHLHIMS
jgi:hypothetical protein